MWEISGTYDLKMKSNFGWWGKSLFWYSWCLEILSDLIIWTSRSLNPKIRKGKYCPTTTTTATAVSRSGDPPWILKRAGLESSGQRLISSIGKTKGIAFPFFWQKERRKKKWYFEIFWDFFRFSDFLTIFDNFWIFWVFFMDFWIFLGFFEFLNFFCFFFFYFFGCFWLFFLEF